MGLLAFLTARRLHAELTRQRDEIARLHQLLDSEAAQRLQAEKQAEAWSQEKAALMQERADLQTALESRTAEWKAEKEELLRRWDAERTDLKRTSEEQLQEAEARVEELRRNLESRDEEHAQLTAQNVRMAERLAECEEKLRGHESSVSALNSKIAELEARNQSLQTDLDRIVGKLNRW